MRKLKLLLKIKLTDISKEYGSFEIMKVEENKIRAYCIFTIANVFARQQKPIYRYKFFYVGTFESRSIMRVCTSVC